MTPEKEFQKIIEYQFKDESLLRHALTHSSYANENRLGPLSDNERLEFLGDSVLQLVSGEFFYQNYPNQPEGYLSKLRSAMVCEVTLAFCATDIRLGQFIYLSRGEDKTGGRERKSVVSDALEALIGAIYLDGGIEPARAFIHRFILTDIEHRMMFHDSKTKLQEFCQQNFKDVVHYQVISTTGPDHDRTYVVEAQAAGNILARGSGASKKAAEQEAAYKALKG